MGNSVPRRHHYVSQFLLRNFADAKGKVCVYDAKEERSHVSATKNVATEVDLYAIPQPSGEPDRRLEDQFFAKEIDGPGETAIQKLLWKGTLDIKEIHQFFFFVAAQYHRTPAALEQLSALLEPVESESLRQAAKHEPRFREHLTARLRRAGETQGAVKELLASIERGEWRARPTSQLRLRLAIGNIMETAQTLTKMRWAFAQVPDDEPDLVISGHPVSLRRLHSPLAPLGLAYDDVEVTLPLSSRFVALARYGGKARYASLLPGAAASINAQQMRGARRFVFARQQTDELMATVRKWHGKGPRLRSRPAAVDGHTGIISAFSC